MGSINSFHLPLQMFQSAWISQINHVQPPRSVPPRDRRVAVLAANSDSTIFYDPFRLLPCDHFARTPTEVYKGRNNAVSTGSLLNWQLQFPGI